MEKISVIISTYNVENYLKKCLDSIINQTIKEIEIICIDDCSTDNSYQILEEYAKKDDRIIILKNEKNTGSSCKAFNIGIKIAKGEYIYFMDSDDYISDDFLYNLYNTAKKYDSDITYTLNVFDIKNNKLVRPWYSEIENWKKSDCNFENTSTITIKNTNIGKKEFINFVCWNKIIKLDFIRKNNITFFEVSSGIDGGGLDNYFIFKCILNSPKTSYNHNSIYYYTVRENSLYRSIKLNPKKIISNIERKKNLIEYSKKYFNENTIYVCSYLWFDILERFILIKDKPSIYNYVHSFAKEIELDKEFQIALEKQYNRNVNYYEFYIIIKNNDTYDKYLLQKELFESIDNIKNKINQLDSKINHIVEKQNSEIKLFGIDKLKDRKIIYIFGIKITIKK